MAIGIDCRQPVSRGELDDQSAIGEGVGVRLHDQSTVRRSRDGADHAFNVGGCTNWGRSRFDA